MDRTLLLGIALLASLSGSCNTTPGVSARDAEPAAPRGWLSWRGPDQSGVSHETGLVDEVTVDGEGHLWSYEMSGRGTPVIANGRVFAQGYEGEGETLEEVLLCLDERTGELLWEHRERDFLSDVIYTRYALGSPTVDPETGHVFTMTGGGLLQAFTPDGELLWERSLTEELGRLSFPNGRTGAPLVIGDRVIMHFIFASWGPLGPARDRFFAFDKHTGDVLWSSTPGGPPKDSSFSMPVVEERDGRFLLYAGLGGGHVSCVDVRTGEAVWRFPLATGGINSSALLHGDRLIAVHGKENLDSTVIGRMVCLDLTAKPGEDGVLGAEAEVWRNDLVAFTSSPVLVGDRVYETTQTGELVCVDAGTGEELWHEKLGADQLHASPTWGDGKLYVPMNDGSFHIVRPTDEGAEVLDTEQLEGACLGAPAIAGGRIYVHTTARLYCFGREGGRAPEWHSTLPGEPAGAPGEAVALQLEPADAMLRAGESLDVTVRSIDAKGRAVAELAADAYELEVPGFVGAGTPGVGVAKATADGLVGTARVRSVPTLPWSEDFEGFELSESDGDMGAYAFPPGHWLQGRVKWSVIDREGERVVARRMDNPLFQRTMSFIGDPEDSNYVVAADVMSDGNRRSMSSVGLINQRYLVQLRGNYQDLEVSSNMERFKVSVPFQWKPGVWYRLVTRVDVAPNGTGVVRAKAWPRDEPEPDAWTLEAEDPHVHTHGAAGVYGFTPQSRFTVYLDNLSVTPHAN